VPRFVISLLRAARWHRRALAAIAAAICVLSTVAALSPPDAATSDVVVAASGLQAGCTLTASDVRVIAVPLSFVPDGALRSASQAVGQVLVAPASRGTQLTDRSLVSASLSPGAGQLLVPFRIADAGVAALLHVGDHVTVVTSGSDGAVLTLAKRVRVAALPQSAGGGGLLSGNSDAGALVVVVADETTARSLAAWASSGKLGIALG